MIFSRVFDVKFYSLHLPGISYRLLAAFLILTGTFLNAFRSWIGKCVLGFTAFLLLSIPFSVWHSGSLNVLFESWLLALTVYMSVAALITDYNQYRRTVHTLAFATLVLTLICLKMGSMESGRLYLEQGRFANPNEMAQALLIGLPFWWAILAGSRSIAGKLFAAGVMGMILLTIGKTGSRGALIAISVTLVFLFLRASMMGKLQLLVTIGLLFSAAVVLLPGSLMQRYQTFFSDSDDTVTTANEGEMMEDAVSSAESRKQMLIESLILTAKHPIVGVGVGMFAVAEDAMARAEGKRHGAWLGTHNSYTEVSSECGIPAALFYLAVLGLSLKSSYSIYRATKRRPELAKVSLDAVALHYSVLAFGITAFFVHAAYTSLLPALAGLAVALVRTTKPLLERPPEPAPAPAMLQPPAKFPRPRYRPAPSFNRSR
ncbi:MAG TPA: O-antigen ligase family protein [Bryobacteraceae bacterium]|nr:O-antigen ligase family protein [Bryobacteraceae bacterium]